MARKLKKLDFKKKIDEILNRYIGRSKLKKASTAEHLKSSSKELEKAREEHNKIGFWKGLKYKIASWFGIKKHTKTGRFGAQKTAVKNDSIERLEEDNQDRYFDPFQKINDEISDSKEGRSLQDDFSERVEDQVALSEKNDWDKGSVSDSEERRLELVYNGTFESEGGSALEKMQNDLAKMSDPYGAFVATVDADNENQTEDELPGAEDAPENANDEAADEPSEENSEADEESHADKKTEQSEGNSEKSAEGDIPAKAPAQFQITVAVSGRPADYYTKMSRLKTLARIAAMGKDKTKGKTKDQINAEKAAEFKELAAKAVTESPEYREITARGQAAATAAGVKYEPLNDPNIHQLIIRTNAIDLRNTGHSSIGMDTLRDDKLVKRYTFGFFPATDTKQEETVIGEVKNPDKSFDEASTKRSYRVSYKDYLKAAAKIRGIKGSRRTYKVTGYNCTSFAIDIAKEAGINFADNEVAEDYVTSSSDFHLVDSPAALASKLEKDNAAASGMNIAEYATVLREAEQWGNKTAGNILLLKMKSDSVKPMLIEYLGKNTAYQNEVKKDKDNIEITPDKKVDTIISVAESIYNKISEQYKIEMDEEGHMVQNDYQTTRTKFAMLKQRKEALMNAFGTDSVYQFVINACKDSSEYSFCMNMEESKDFVFGKDSTVLTGMFNSGDHDQVKGISGGLKEAAQRKAEEDRIRAEREEEERKERAKREEEERRINEEKAQKEAAVRAENRKQKYAAHQQEFESIFETTPAISGEGYDKLYDDYMVAAHEGGMAARQEMLAALFDDFEKKVRERLDPSEKFMKISPDNAERLYIAILLCPKKRLLLADLEDNISANGGSPMFLNQVGPSIKRIQNNATPAEVAMAYKYISK